MFTFERIMPIKFKFSDFPDGIHELTFLADSNKLDLGSNFFGDVALDVIMDKSSHQIVLKCEAEVSAEFECDRCTEKFESKVSTNFLLVYVFDEASCGIDDVNCYFLRRDENTIDITKDTKEYLRLAVPMKNVCSSECNGICPTCGKNLNYEQCNCTKDEINPVWNELLKLKENK